MKNLLLSIIVLLALMSCHQPESEYKLLWSDEFNYTGLPDSSKWSYDTVGNAWGWGNNELQYYTVARKENAYVSDGTLKITAVKEKCDGFDYTSARLITKAKGDWRYGRFEIRAKLPDGLGLWPAIWMLPSDWKYGGWPASGEIDIMENVGYVPDTIVASVHTQKYNHVIGTQHSTRISLPDNRDEFHVYGVEWDSISVNMFVDDSIYFNFKNEFGSFDVWPFDQRFHLLLNLAVGGNWGGKMGVDESVFPAVMEVDYVRVFEKVKK